MKAPGSLQVQHRGRHADGTVERARQRAGVRARWPLVRLPRGEEPRDFHRPEAGAVKEVATNVTPNDLAVTGDGLIYITETKQEE